VSEKPNSGPVSSVVGSFQTMRLACRSGAFQVRMASSARRVRTPPSVAGSDGRSDAYGTVHAATMPPHGMTKATRRSGLAARAGVRGQPLCWSPWPILPLLKAEPLSAAVPRDGRRWPEAGMRASICKEPASRRAPYMCS